LLERMLLKSRELLLRRLGKTVKRIREGYLAGACQRIEPLLIERLRIEALGIKVTLGIKHIDPRT
jgi:hypothetical protein